MANWFKTSASYRLSVPEQFPSSWLCCWAPRYFFKQPGGRLVTNLLKIDFERESGSFKRGLKCVSKVLDNVPWNKKPLIHPKPQQGKERNLSLPPNWAQSLSWLGRGGRYCLSRGGLLLWILLSIWHRKKILLDEAQWTGYFLGNQLCGKLVIICICVRVEATSPEPNSPL